MFCRFVTLSIAVLLTQNPGFSVADVVTLIPEGSYPTGANANALAGPLFSSDFDSVDIPGPGPGFAIASLSGNAATHDFAVKLDFSSGPAFFDSSYFGPFFRTPTLDHRASAESIYHFSVDVPTVFDVSGFFSVVDSVGTTVPGNVELEIELLEFDTPFLPMGPLPSTVFYSYQVSKTTLGETFMVGGSSGDAINVLTGMPSGLLDPSKFYRYRTLVTINAIDIDGSGSLPATDGFASATGAHVITFSTVSIPEPSTGIALLFGMIFTFIRRRSIRIT